MGIHQAVIGGYSYSPVGDNWEVANYNVGFFTIPESSLQANDLIFFVLGSDISQPSLETDISTTTLIDTTINSIEVLIKYAVVPSTPNDIDGFTDCDYAMTMGFRRSGSTSATYNISVEATNTTLTSPSHNNTSVAFSQDDLALLLAFVDDDFTAMTPPTDSTKIGESSSSGGSLGSAYKQIDTAGNYSWGSWTTSGTDSTVAYVIKIQEYDS